MQSASEIQPTSTKSPVLKEGDGYIPRLNFHPNKADPSNSAPNVAKTEDALGFERSMKVISTKAKY
jgi:hypothetical protein